MRYRNNSSSSHESEDEKKYIKIMNKLEIICDSLNRLKNPNYRQVESLHYMSQLSKNNPYDYYETVSEAKDRVRRRLLSRIKGLIIEIKEDILEQEQMDLSPEQRQELEKKKQGLFEIQEQLLDISFDNLNTKLR